jgi:hypothetical protein
MRAKGDQAKANLKDPGERVKDAFKKDAVSVRRVEDNGALRRLAWAAS